MNAVNVYANAVHRVVHLSEHGARDDTTTALKLFNRFLVMGDKKVDIHDKNHQVLTYQESSFEVF